MTHRRCLLFSYFPLTLTSVLRFRIHYFRVFELQIVAAKNRILFLCRFYNFKMTTYVIPYPDASVADPGCLSRILIKEFKYFNPQKQKNGF
jgi:hypothetical protein